MDFALLATGIAIGLSVTAPLGPVNVIVMRTALRRSLGTAFLVGAGAVAADAVFATVAAYGVRSIDGLILAYAPYLTIAAGLLMVTIGIRIAQSHVNMAEVQSLEPPTRRQIVRKVLTTFTLTITNPATLFGFLAIFGTMSGVLRLSASPLRPLIVITGVVVGGLAWWLLVSFAVSKLKARLNGHAFDRINRWAGIVIAGFGFALLMQLVW